MQLSRKSLLATFTAVGMALVAPGTALAFTSVEGAVIGDQGFYWTVPGESWIFPHRIGNIDNRVMLQWDAAPGSTPAGPLFNQLDVQNSRGGGLVLELMPDFNLGLWVSEYGGAWGFNGTTNFFDRAIGETGWTGASGVDDLVGIADPYATGASAGRKLDLFASYWLPDSGLETGLHLSWASTHRKVKPDESLGPVDIDTDSDTTTTTTGFAPGADDELAIAEGKYSLSDLGIGLGGAYTGMENLRADLGLNFNILSAGYSPNGIDNYLDAGGLGLDLDARVHYALSDAWTVGAFVRFARTGLHFEPQKQRDGGDLPEAATLDDATASGLPTPSGGGIASGPSRDPAGTGELTPVQGTKYEESNSNFQIAFLGRYQPLSRVKLYGALGFNRVAQTNKLSVGDNWYEETSTINSTLPFIHVGFEGKVFENLDMFLGAVKRWNGTTSADHFFDGRIPDNGEGEGGVDPAAGNADNTNANRRDIQEESNVDASQTRFLLGARVHYGPVAIVGQVDPGLLLRGLYFLSGSPGNTFLWASLTYDWDYDQDIKSGNGTITGGAPSPHDAAPGAEMKKQEMPMSSSEG